MKKRILSGMLAISMVFGSAAMLPVGTFTQSTIISVSAENAPTSGKCGENVNWSLKGGVLTISGTGNMYDYQFEASPFNARDDIKSVVIKAGVTSIGEYAFAQSALTSITIPNSVTKIGDFAFSSCTNLKSVTIPSKVTSIGVSTFSHCASLTSVTIPNSVTSIGEYAFINCSNLSRISIPSSVTNIGSEAFQECTKLTNIIIPDSVTTIEDNVFFGCTNLTHVSIPSSVSNIGNSAFSYCPNLSSITIPNSVTNIGYCAFYGCTNLKSVTIPNTVTSIDWDAFSGTQWLEDQQKENPLVIVNGILIDGTKCSGNVSIPDNVTIIGNDAFDGCSSLTSVTIPNSVTSIGRGAFKTCTSLTSVIIPKSVTNIGVMAFGYYSSFNQQYNDFVIKGYNNTAAEKYAKDNEFKFEPLPDYSLDSTKNEVFVTKDNLKDIILTYHRTEEDNNTLSLFRGVQVDGKPIDATNYTAESGSLKLTLKKDYLSKISVGTHKLTVLFEDTYVETDLIVKKTSATTKLRLAGAGRYETAVEISKAGFPDGSDTVVLAYGLNYADALAGVSLAKAKNAPILLTNLKTLPAETLAEIKRLKAKNVIILGGTGAVGAEVEKTLKNNDLDVERIAGATRFETATKIAQKMQVLNDNKAPEDIFFVYAFNSADALSVSPIAACKNAPIIYLSTKGDLNADTAAYLAKLKKADCVKNAYFIGGEGVISNDMATKAAKALGLSKTTRIAGKDRFATCVAVNEKFAYVLDGDMLCVATGMDFPDALAGGVYAAINKAPLFLINGKAKTPQLSDEQKAYLKTKAAGKITAFGGTGVVPDSHIADIAKNLT